MKKYLALALLLLSFPSLGAPIFSQGEAQAFLLKLAPDSRVTKSLNGSSAFGWVRFIEKRTICTGYPWCTQYWRHCLIGRFTGDPDIISQLTAISTSQEGTLHDVVLPDGRWFKTNVVNSTGGDIPQADKDWCLG